MISVVGYIQEALFQPGQGIKVYQVLQELAQYQLDDLYDYILDVYANSGTGYYGQLAIGSTGNILATFTDTRLSGNTGDPNVSIISTSYDVSQNTSFYYSEEYSTPNNALSNPSIISLVTSAGTTVLQANVEPLVNFADNVITRLVVDRSIGSFYLGYEAPVDGDTWVSIGEIDNLVDNTGIPQSITYLWKKTAKSGSSTPVRPVYLDTNNQLAQLSTSDLTKYIAYIERRMASTGRGQYVLQPNAPAVGTWVDCGSITDYRLEILSSSYELTTDYTSLYLGTTYEGENETIYNRSSFDIPYEGSYDQKGAGGTFNTTTYTNDLYVGAGDTYQGPNTNYTGPQTTYILSYDGPIFIGQTDIDYLGESTYLSPGVYVSTSPYTETYTGDTTYTGAAAYLGAPATAGYNTDYTGPANFIAPEALSYLSSPDTQDYAGNTGFMDFSGTASVLYTTDYADIFEEIEGAFSATYTLSYTGPASDYILTSLYGSANYSTYLGPLTNYITDPESTYTTGYVEDISLITYSNDYIGNVYYINTSYNSGNYVATSLYIGTYESAFTTDYVNFTAGTIYTGTPEVPYATPTEVDYNSYLSTTAEYGASFESTYVLDELYTDNVAGIYFDPVGDTLALWLRIA